MPASSLSVFPRPRPRPDSAALAAAWGRRYPYTPDTAAWARNQVEKIRGAWFSGNLVLPPFLDNFTLETQEIRDAYLPMLSEPYVKAGYGVKVWGVAALDCSVVPADPDDERQRAAADAFRWVLGQLGNGGPAVKNGRPSGPPLLAWEILSGALACGWSLSELVPAEVCRRPGPAYGKEYWPDIKSRDVRRLAPRVDEFKNVIAIRSFFGAEEWSGADLDSFVTFAHWPIYCSPHGLSDFRAVYRAAWIKNVAMRLRALGLDRWTHPYLKGTAATNEQKDALRDALEDARGNGFVVVGPGDLIEAVSLAVGSDDVFHSAIQDLEREILVGVSWSHLPIQEGQTTGGRGDTSVQQGTAELGQWALASSLGGVVTAQMCRPWYERNYADVEPATVVWGSVNEQALIAAATLDQKLLALGMKLSRKERQQFYGRAAPADEADALIAPPKGPGPGGNGGGPGGAGGSSGGNGKPPGGNPPGLPFAEDGSDTGADEEPTDPDETALLIAEMLYHLFGADAAKTLASEDLAEKFAAGWNESDHPRGSGGRFIPRGSPEAIKAAKDVVKAVLKGDPNATPDDVARHLAILNVKQLRQLHKEAGVKSIPSVVLRQHLVEAVTDRLATSKEMKALREEFARVRGARPPDTMTASNLKKQIAAAKGGPAALPGAPAAAPAAAKAGAAAGGPAAPAPTAALPAAPAEPYYPRVQGIAATVPPMVDDLLTRHGGDLGRARAALESELKKFPRSSGRETTSQMLDEVKRRQQAASAPATKEGPVANATVKYEHPKAAAQAAAVLGKKASDADLAALAGAPDGARVYVDQYGDDKVGIYWNGGDRVRARLVLSKGANGRPELRVKDFVNEGQARGTAAAALERMKTAGKRLGVARITMEAAGAPGTDQNGYYTWAKLGVDGPIPDEVRGHLPMALAGAKTVQDVMRAPGGAEWWKANGLKFEGSMDLTGIDRPSQSTVDSRQSIVQNRPRREPDAAAAPPRPQGHARAPADVSAPPHLDALHAGMGGVGSLDTPNSKVNELTRAALALSDADAKELWHDRMGRAQKPASYQQAIARSIHDRRTSAQVVAARGGTKEDLARIAAGEDEPLDTPPAASATQAPATAARPVKAAPAPPRHRKAAPAARPGLHAPAPADLNDPHAQATVAMGARVAGGFDALGGPQAAQQAIDSHLADLGRQPAATVINAARAAGISRPLANRAAAVKAIGEKWRAALSARERAHWTGGPPPAAAPAPQAPHRPGLHARAAPDVAAPHVKAAVDRVLNTPVQGGWDSHVRTQLAGLSDDEVRQAAADFAGQRYLKGARTRADHEAALARAIADARGSIQV